MPKNEPARIFLYFRATGLRVGLSAMHPTVQGKVATKYEIMNISCQP